MLQSTNPQNSLQHGLRALPLLVFQLNQRCIGYMQDHFDQVREILSAQLDHDVQESLRLLEEALQPQYQKQQ